MDDDTPLLPEEELHARTGDPWTSHAAMAAYDKAKMQSAITHVVDLHTTHGPLADFELEGLFESTFLSPHCAHLYRQARSSARDKGQIRNTGQTKINPSTKRHQVIWEACTIDTTEIPRCPTCGKLLRDHTKKAKEPMREELTDLWLTPCDARCITTNGDVRKDHAAVMGRGCAKEAAERYKQQRLAHRLGNAILHYGNHTQVVLALDDDPPLVAFPVKHHWDEQADLALIARSAQELMALIDSKGWQTVLLPRPGCGNGKLSWDRQVRPILRPLLDHRVTVITQ